MVSPLEPHVLVKKQKCLIGYKGANEALERGFQNSKYFENSLNRYREIAT